MAGTSVELADASWGGGTWGADGTIIYTPGYNRWALAPPARGGKPEMVTTPDSVKGELAHWWPRFLPDQRHVIFTNFSTPITVAKVEVVDLKTGARKVLVEGGIFARYVAHRAPVIRPGRCPPRHSIRPDHLTTSGSARTCRFRTSPWCRPTAWPRTTSRPTATLPMCPVRRCSAPTQPAWVDRSGNETSAEAATVCCTTIRSCRLMAAGWHVTSAPREGKDVWIYDFDRDILSQLTFGIAIQFRSRMDR